MRGGSHISRANEPPNVLLSGSATIWFRPFHLFRFVAMLLHAENKTETENAAKERETRFCAERFLRFSKRNRSQSQCAASFSFRTRQVSYCGQFGFSIRRRNQPADDLATRSFDDIQPAGIDPNRRRNSDISRAIGGWRDRPLPSCRRVDKRAPPSATRAE
jgi:hypothetical protein